MRFSVLGHVRLCGVVQGHVEVYNIGKLTSRMQRV